jgi:hypothetical protein
MLDSHRAHSISPRGERNDWTHGMSPSPIRHNSSPGTDLESDGPTHQSPQVPADQPAGVDSDDNFEVSDDADERQVQYISVAECVVVNTDPCLCIGCCSW